MRTGVFVIIAFFLCAGALNAQRVLYSPFVSSNASFRFEVAGSTSGHYWLQTGKPELRRKKANISVSGYKDLRFEIYDSRMNLVNTIPYDFPEDLIKEYLIAGREYFDRLIFRQNDQLTEALLYRYSEDGNTEDAGQTVAKFPAGLKAEDFLMIRSQDRTKILLLGFESIADSSPVLHAFLYDQDWTLLDHSVYRYDFISKPWVQYELMDYPLEDYSSAPVKLSNLGDWFMMIPSVANRNYLLLHFNSDDTIPERREIKFQASPAVEDMGLYIDNKLQEGFAGLMTRARKAGARNVRVVHFSFTGLQVDFDTSYYFNSYITDKSRSKKIFEEYFLVVPGKGFVYMKEYGKQLPNDVYEDPWYRKDESDTGYFTQQLASPNDFWKKDEYTRYDNLSGSRKDMDRGDLTIFYFSAKQNDSSWSGMINKKQVTELNRATLSYAFLSKQNKLFFLYNNSLKDDFRQYGNTTVLDEKGNLLNEGLEFWKIKNTLVFQKARQISENELAVPYIKDRRNGFAIIRL